MTEKEKLRIKLLAEAREQERNSQSHKTPASHSSWGDREEDDGLSTPELSQHDLDSERFLHPSIDEQLNSPGSSLTGLSIREELADEYLMGKVAPFVEGTPIGTIPLNRRQK